MEIEYRVLDKPRDYENLRALFRLSFPEAFGTSIETNAHFAWKFESYPATPPSYQYVAAESSDLVGYYAAIPFPYSIDGTVETCGMVCDVMTHPERRGKGIFTRIGHSATSEMRHEGLGFTAGYPVRPEVIPGHLKVGWQIVKRLPVYIRVLGVRSFLPQRLRFLAPVIDPIVRVLQYWALHIPARYSAVVLQRNEFLGRHANNDDEYATFLQKWISQQPNALLKTCDFLRWRTGAPESEYLFVPLRHQGELVGLAIARPAQLKGVETLAVLDFMVLQEHVQGSRALHEQLRRVAREYRKDAVACMCSSQSAKLYRFAGSAYLRSHHVFTLIVKKLDDRIPDDKLYSEDRWQPFWLDSDDL
jgi:GNAT superfamily N-acetyltransferase